VSAPGKVVAVRGSVVEIEFPAELPAITEALRLPGAEPPMQAGAGKKAGRIAQSRSTSLPIEFVQEIPKPRSQALNFTISRILQPRQIPWRGNSPANCRGSPEGAHVPPTCDTILDSYLFTAARCAAAVQHVCVEAQRAPAGGFDRDATGP